MYISAVIEWGPSRCGPSCLRRVPRRRPPSTSSTVRSVCSEGTSCAASTRATVGDDVGEPQLTVAGTPARTPRWRRCRPPGAVPPRAPASPGQPDGGERLVVEREELPGLRAASSPPAGAASGTRSGQPRPSAIGISIDGGDACASVEPSLNSTIECTTEVGCTTTSIRSNGMPNSRCASITSRPLLTRVAELIVTTGPMSQVGCASACSGVTSCSSSRLRPRNGPPLAVSTSRRTSSARPPRRHCASALCSESTGTIWPGLRARGDHRAADDQRLLVGQREGVAGVERGQRRPQPDRAGDAVEHHVALHRGRLRRGLLAEVGERRRELLDLRAEQVRLRAAGGQRRPPGTGPGWPGRRRAPGCRSTRSSRGGRRRDESSPGHPAGRRSHDGFAVRRDSPTIRSAPAESRRIRGTGRPTDYAGR